MDTKCCSTCQILKPLSEFNTNKEKKDGHGSICKDCNKLYQKAHYQRNKQYYLDKSQQRKNETRAFIISIKNTLKCEICGETHIACLDFHHKDDDKSYTIADTVRRKVSRNRIQEEMKKCNVLCANCHRKVHFKEIPL